MPREGTALRVIQKVEIMRGEKSDREILSAVASAEVLQMWLSLLEYWRLHMNVSFCLGTKHRYHSQPETEHMNTCDKTSPCS